MLRILIAGLALGLLAVAPAGADPTGRYRATIIQPDGKPVLAGSVTVIRVDEIYQVDWVIDGKSTTGVALGGAFNRGDLVVGPAHAKDLMLTIGFRDGDAYGSATMILQIDGSYQGYRVSSGSAKALPERWDPVR